MCIYTQRIIVAYIVIRECISPDAYLCVDKCTRERILHVLVGVYVRKYVRAYASGHGSMQYLIFALLISWWRASSLSVAPPFGSTIRQVSSSPSDFSLMIFLFGPVAN